jgi:Cu-Zn family superoxide dismutase
MKTLTTIIVLLTSLSAFAAKPPKANASLVNAQGASVGTASFEQTTQGVKITLQAQGLTPGEHGIHVHEKGQCASPDFKSAGGHFNPLNKEHGLTHPKGHHAGDLPNLMATSDGKTEAELLLVGASLKPGKDSLLRDGGTALVIHAKADDGKSQPAGDSGDRVLCGVIQTAK